MKAPLIAILTDFGTQDPFVGIMKAVIHGISPGMPFIDLTHEISPGDIRQAGISLWQSIDYFPSGSVFLCVVDPGVGTSRRAIIAELSRGEKRFILVGPDNGLFTFVLGENYSAWELSNPDYALSNPGATFHGRDLFAPAAAWAGRGAGLNTFGSPVLDPLFQPLPRLDFIQPGLLEGEILFADRFGNLLTSLGRFQRMEGNRLSFHAWLPGAEDRQWSGAAVRLELPGGRTLPFIHTFQDSPPGECAALIGSSGLIEIVANRQSAAARLGLQGGEPVSLLIS